MSLSRKIGRESLHALRGLENAGLQKKEALVYLSLLKQGQVGASSIVRDTGLHGQFIYNALNSLEEQGLVQYVMVRGRKKFQAKNPRHLSEQLAERKRNIDDLISELEAEAVISPENQFNIFQGHESFVAKETELIKRMPENGTVLVVGGEGDQYVKQCGKAIHELDYIRSRKNIMIRYIGAQPQKQELEGRASQGPFSYRLLPGTFQGESNYAVYKELGIFGLYVFTDPVTSFLVENKKVSQNFISFFETLWKLGQ